MQNPKDQYIDFFYKKSYKPAAEGREIWMNTKKLIHTFFHNILVYGRLRGLFVEYSYRIHFQEEQFKRDSIYADVSINYGKL